MRTKTAVEVDLGESGKGWHYASIGSEGGGPIGLCMSHAPHPTEGEARLCYTAYLKSRLRQERYGDWTGCEVGGCDKPTKNGWTADSIHGVATCDEHNTADVAIPLLGLDRPAGDSFGSLG